MRLEYMATIGVDEAGRGSVLGPMIIAGVKASKYNIKKFAKEGIKDSKLVSPKKREIFARLIKELSDEYIIKKVNPKTIDNYVINGKKFRRLNYLEAKTMAKIIDNLFAKTAYVDACDINAKRYGITIKEQLHNPIRIYSSHKADMKYTVVGAASILAKVTRDNEIKKLKKKYGDIGSGYPSDDKTIKFLKRYKKENKEFPKCVRFSWKTLKRI